MATTATISARTREETGKGAARSSRREGRIPGVLYGHGEESVSLSVDANELQKLVHSISIENTIVDLDIGKGDPYKVLIREVQRHPFRDEFIHIDFFHVAMDEKIQVEIPIVLIGTPTGVKNKGGVMDHQLRELEVFCLPGNIPEKVEIDVSDLDIGDSIHVSDIQLPDVEVLTDLDRAVVAVLAPTVIEVEEAAAEEAILEPEVIGRGKEEEEEEGETGRSRREEEKE
ncbi:MAG TPA: 50S ribosomal protein L25/general stress protein Ctc [Gemmatimonadota bacterium]|nr:50S ribosomal protein L25/general stress protein Ctc [Gemmatimonadota bacterium]